MVNPSGSQTAVNYRVTPEQHRTIRTAAGISGSTMSNYARTVTLERARQDVDEYIQKQTAPAADGAGRQQ